MDVDVGGEIAPVQVEHRLVKLEEGCRAIAEARSIEEINEIRDMAQAMAHYVRERDLGIQAQHDAAEIKIRAERRMGEMLAVMPGKGTHGGNRRASPSVKLEELGITKMDSHRWQKIAGIPANSFEAHIVETRSSDKEKELTTAGVLRLAAELNKCEPPPKQFNLLVESELIETWIRKRYNAWPEKMRPAFIDTLRRIIERIEESLDDEGGGGTDCATDNHDPDN